MGAKLHLHMSGCQEVTVEYDRRSPRPNHSHAWRGTWNRPMYIDEDSMDAFTVARMTDHNVRGTDVDDLPGVAAATAAGEPPKELQYEFEVGPTR